jgi:hypothetical protein
MSEVSDLLSTDIEQYLRQHETKSLLRFITCGSVDDGKSTLIGRLLYDSKSLFSDQLAAVAARIRDLVPAQELSNYLPRRRAQLQYPLSPERWPAEKDLDAMSAIVGNQHVLDDRKGARLDAARYEARDRPIHHGEAVRGGRVDAQSDLVAPNVDNGDHDVIADHDAFFFLRTCFQ